MKKRLIMLASVILFITGCSSKYTLTISDKGLEENIDLTIPKSYIKEQTEEEKNADIAPDDQITPFIENDQYPLYGNNLNTYTKKVSETDDSINVNLNYFYKPSEFSNSNTLKKCFDNYGYSYENGYYLKASGKFYCLYSDEIEINIKTKNKVTKHNADKVSGNVYTWYINEDNKNNIDIEIKTSKSNITATIITYGVLALAVIMIVILVIKFYQKNKKANEI